MIKKLSTPIKIVTAYNAIQTVTTIYILSQYLDQTWLAILSLIEISFVIAANYFLIKEKKWAWTALLIWFILITFTFEIPLFAWGLSYGLHLTTSWTLTLGSFTFEMGLDFVSLILLIVHYKSKKHFNSTLNSKEIFNDIQIEEKKE
jgi:hypothetical protein